MSPPRARSTTDPRGTAGSRPDNSDRGLAQATTPAPAAAPTAAAVTARRAAASGARKGQAYASAARELVGQLRAIGTRYGHQLTDKGERAPDFMTDDRACDCTKFVLKAALKADGVDFEKTPLPQIRVPLFGNRRLMDLTSVTGMTAAIDALVAAGSARPIRTDSPQAGDLIVWGRHVAIVTAVGDRGGMPTVSFANMWVDRGGGPTELSGAPLADLPKYGAGAYQGFWTPPPW